jgi:hypothetical protein
VTVDNATNDVFSIIMLERILLLIAISLVSGGFWHGSVGTSQTTADLNFAAQSYSGCASLTACITTTRASPETCTDSAGALTYAANDVACLTDLGLAAYAGATNLLVQSGDIGSGSWGTYTTGNGTIVKTSNSGAAPDGTSTAALVTLNVTAGEGIAAQTFNATAAVYTSSCYIKAFAGGDVGKRITLYMVDGAFAAYNWTPVTLTADWVRYGTTRTLTASGNQLGFGFLGAAGGTYQSGEVKFYIWGCQAELGNNVMTPLVPTTAATASRASTNHRATGPLLTMLNGSTSSVVFKSSVSLAGVAGTMIDANGSLILGKTVGNNLTSAAGVTLSTETTGTWTELLTGGLAWDSNGRSLELLKGGVIATDGNALALGAPIRFGSTGGTTAFFNGYLQRLQTRNYRLTNAQLTAAIPDIQSPTVAITAPTGGSVSGSVTVSASASDDVAVASVQFTVDGSNFGVAATVAPYSSAWDSTSVANGSHAIGATVTDTAGNSSVASTVTVNVNNGVGVAYYFSSTGSDTSNDCTNSASPCQTISKANGIVKQAGDSILLKRGDTFTGCININATNWFGTQGTPGIVGAFSSGAAPILNANCTGETGAVWIHEASGVTVQDLDIRAPTVPTPRGGIMIQNNSSTRIGGIIIQRNLIGGARYFQSTRPGGIGTQGTNGGNIEIKGYPNPGGMENISVLNNTICGLSGVDSADDTGRSGFGGSIFNETWRGNIMCNIGGGPSDVTANGVNYPPMGSGAEFNGVTGILAEFNIAHDLSNNFISCGGPVGMYTYQSADAMLQFNEVYNVQPKASNYAHDGQCDFIGLDFDGFTNNSTAQYNYTHDNWGAGFYHFTTGGAWNNNTFRYGISENDSKGGAPSFGALALHIDSGNPFLYMYNNTTFNNRTYSGAQFGNYNQMATGLSIPTSGVFRGAIVNNIIATSKSVYNLCHFTNNNTPGFAPTVVISNNRYYCTNAGTDWRWGNVAYSTIASFQAATGYGANSTVGNPVWGSTRPTGTCSWTPSSNDGPQSCPDGYHLSAGSSVVLGTGVDSVFGLNVGTRDYYGNSITGGNGIGSGFNMGADGQAH